MTEAEWMDYPNPENTDADPEKMLKVLQSPVSERKLRLLALASCLLVCERLRYPQSTKAIETLGRYAEGLASPADLATAAKGAWDAAATWGSGPLFPHFEDEGNVFIEESTQHEAVAWAVEGPDQDGSILGPITNALVRLGTKWKSCYHVRCIFGNPFRPVTADPAWLTSDVVALAEGIYQDRAFDRLPILADALQDAGCGNEDLLSHCRSDGPHVRGCWVIDLLTGRK